MIPTAKNSLKALSKELEEIECSFKSDPLKKIALSHDVSKKYCDHLVQSLFVYKFKDLAEQIEFFKILKPGIFCHLFYYRKIMDIEHLCLHSRNQRKRIIIEELARKSIFFDSHEEMYSYYKEGRTDLDDKYFTRMERIGIGLYKSDEFMFSAHDLLFAKFKAYEQVEIYLVEELQKIVSHNQMAESNNAFKRLKSLGIVWTGTVRDLVELLSSLHQLKCINHGNLSLRNMFEISAFLFNLNINMKDVYNSRNQIKLRKKNETSFLEKLKHASQEEQDNYFG
jgi:hypothetical protein